MSDQEPLGITPEVQNSPPFSIPVEIGGLPYLFRGILPIKRAPLKWTVHIPDWEAHLSEIKASTPIENESELQKFETNEGEVGYVSLGATGHADIRINMIKSATEIMPRNSSYFKARGVGSFLMNNLLAFADLKGWSVSATPDPDGSLSREDIHSWNLRKGFVDSGGSMIRYPQQPDMNQVIMQVAQPHLRA